ncbi:sensor histidine kinase [Hydrogenophaga taeniospiralis]|uniref:sensor histidine kinase n=1 Tax=Hydrogenophaga taeniospiralis TaxID=65656 RepID=UPI001CFA4565|nr:sensor histidine kinase [Hydrogenophaga taeniospiralis]MCB4365857.1 sensor histidine kinase [Hydrogenophaga taeniospiralis]
MKHAAPPRSVLPSLRRVLLLGILLPVFGFVLVNTVVLYRQALAAADTAYDRTLLASAKSLSEQLQVAGEGDRVHVQSTLLYSALEAFEADNRSRIYYRVSGFNGEMVSGFDDLPAARLPLPEQKIYAALVHFYDDEYRGDPVRMAVLLQPVAGVAGQGMATIQVAETLELRQTLARQILIDTLWRQAVLVIVIVLVVVVVVQRATRPVRALSHALETRSENDLSPLPTGSAPRELLPLIEATNQHMQRLAQLLEHQKRFVRDTSHQLRTPLAVLKTQVQSARRGDVAPQQALEEIGHTVERATELANQMLALAKVEQLRQEKDAPLIDWATVVRTVSLDLSPLIAERSLDFSLDVHAAPVRAHEWALRELSRNLLHNAIKNTPQGSRLAVALVTDAQTAALTISDSGPGISPTLRERLFQPFATDQRPSTDGLGSGSGLGLAICHGIVLSLGGSIDLVNRESHGKVQGLDATVRLPLART